MYHKEEIYCFPLLLRTKGGKSSKLQYGFQLNKVFGFKCFVLVFWFVSCGFFKHKSGLGVKHTSKENVEQCCGNFFKCLVLLALSCLTLILLGERNESQLIA